MEDILNIVYIFPIAITLHNIEEALWLPEWSQHAAKYHKPVKRNEFHFAVLCVTILAYLISFSYAFNSHIEIIKYAFWGFVGAMVINAIFPHLIATIVMRKYALGVLTGMFINIPCFSLMITYAIKNDLISVRELIISTVIVGGVLISILPVLFAIGRKIVKF
ncbi:HXXEE domain-containing protein [Wukongibacter sp. M2B1]|uniref:HXXEE domain-containing protein n=1 Tax=Wukongibacter sp. M2B1 TaxID=3088895 RepID=UPI003D79251C